MGAENWEQVRDAFMVWGNIRRIININTFSTTSAHIYLQSANRIAVNQIWADKLFRRCGAAMPGMADTDLIKLQHVQNWQARFATNSPSFTRRVPLLWSLHWLRVRFRIMFQICVLTSKPLSWKMACLSSLHTCPLVGMLQSYFWQKLHLPLTHISCVQIMLLACWGSAVHSLLSWSGWCKINCNCSSVQSSQLVQISFV